MLLVTLSSLIAEVQKRADIQNATTFIPTADITEYVNRGISRVHGLLAKSGEPYYRSSASWSTTSGQQQYYTTSAVGVPSGTNVLPTDIFLVEALDAQVQGTRFLNCERFQFERRNDFQQPGPWEPLTTFLYDFRGSGASASIFLQPPPTGAQAMLLWYFPVPPQLAANGDTWDSANRWDAYVIDWAARLCAEKDENYELCARLDASLAQLEAMIQHEAENRIKGAAPKVRRTRYNRRGGWPWGVGGIP